MAPSTPFGNVIAPPVYSDPPGMVSAASDYLASEKSAQLLREIDSIRAHRKEAWAKFGNQIRPGDAIQSEYLCQMKLRAGKPGPAER